REGQALNRSISRTKKPSYGEDSVPDPCLPHEPEVFQTRVFFVSRSILLLSIPTSDNVECGMDAEFAYIVIAVVVVLGIVAFLLRNRVNLFSLKWGDKSARIEAERQSPGVRVEGIDARLDVIAVDKTGKG